MNYQRTAPIGGVTYVVSGAGAYTRPAGIAEFTVVSEAVVNFVLVSGTPDRLTATVHTDDRIVDWFDFP